MGRPRQRAGLRAPHDAGSPGRGRAEVVAIVAEVVNALGRGVERPAARACPAQLGALLLIAARPHVEPDHVDVAAIDEQVATADHALTDGCHGRGGPRVALEVEAHRGRGAPALHAVVVAELVRTRGDVTGRAARAEHEGIVAVLDGLPRRAGGAGVRVGAGLGVDVVVAGGGVRARGREDERPPEGTARRARVTCSRFMASPALRGSRDSARSRPAIARRSSTWCPGSRWCRSRT